MTTKARPNSEIEVIYLRIWSEILTARHRLDDFHELNQHHMILNEVAPSFFGLVMSLLIGDAVMALCRVTDPPEHRGFEHLSIELLRDTVPNSPPTAAVAVAMKPLRSLRNNWISHADLQSAVGGAKATIVLGEIEAAIETLLAWLKDFGTIAGFATADPIDQGTWKSSQSLTAALRDGRAVQEAYSLLLAKCLKSEHANEIDAQLTSNRRGWEDPPFSESEWLHIRARVLETGLRNTANEIDPHSIYALILAQAESRDSDLMSNWTDRRIVARIRSEADWVLRELQFRRGEPVRGLGTFVPPNKSE